MINYNGDRIVKIATIYLEDGSELVVEGSKGERVTISRHFQGTVAGEVIIKDSNIPDLISALTSIHTSMGN